ncbi:MAG TPA: hypothetical protein ENN76_00930 [Euryarchaeota archaeon]|nr:hypothetical protein [Euryarchaeota archaeon]
MSFVLASMCMLVPSVSAESYEGTISIAPGGYYALELDAKMGDVLTYRISSDVPVDIMLMNETFFHFYQETVDHGIIGGIVYDKGGSNFNVTKISHWYRLLIEDKYFLVIDNTDQPTFGAFPVSTANVEFVIKLEINPWTLDVIVKTTFVATASLVAVIAMDHMVWKHKLFACGETAPIHASGVRIKRVIRTTRIIKRR